MPEDMSEYMPEDMSDRMPEDMSEYMPEDMPDGMPEDMSDRVPEDMPDRMPEDLPVRKCINVMVGITRSKVFFFAKIQQNTKTIQIKYKKIHFVFLYFFVFSHYVQKCNLYFCIFFLYFSSPSQIALCPFVFFAFFRHAVKEQNRESINVCCIFLLLIILPCSVLYFFVIWSCIFFVFFIFNDYRVHSL